MPAFLQSDDEEETFGDGLLSGVNVRRRRRQYDERMDEDDVEGEDVSAKFCRLDLADLP
jgi:DNA replication licensing factor MCM2